MIDIDILEFHPAANLFPMMDSENLKTLAEDISANGLLEPVVLLDGKVLDGRNRLAACRLAGVEPHFEDANGHAVSPVSYVLSKNLHRRQLTTSQRGAIAACAVPLLREEARKRQIGTLKQNQQDSPLVPYGTNGKATDVAALQLGVGRNTVERALKVQRADPELFEKVKQGAVRVTTAERAITDRKLRKEIKEVGQPSYKKYEYEINSKRGREIAAAQRRKLSGAIGTIDGICMWLPKVDMSMLRAVCEREEVESWAEKAAMLSKILGALARNLRRES